MAELRRISDYEVVDVLGRGGMLASALERLEMPYEQAVARAALAR